MNLFFWKIFLFPFKMFLKKVQWSNNFPKKFILAGNHEGYMAPPIIMNLVVFKTSKKIIFLAFRLWFSFLYIKLFNCIESNNAVSKCVDLLKKGFNIGIFPEGERNYFNKLKPFKTGVSAIALLSGIPVIPFGIKKSTGLPFFSAEVNFGKPLYFKKCKQKKIPKNLLLKTTSIIKKQIALLSGKKL